MSADDLAAQLAALKGVGAVAARFHENGQLAEVRFADATPAVSPGGKTKADGDGKTKRDPLLNASRMRPGDGG